MKEELAKYVENIGRIRSLSSPKLNNVMGSDEYGVLLLDNFLTIGQLATENREILEKHLFPYLRGEVRLDKMQADILTEMEDALCDLVNLDDLDPFVHSWVSEKLLEQTESDGSVDELVSQLDREVSICYTMVLIISRVPHRKDLTEKYRERGIIAGTKLLEFLEPSLFESLDNESRIIAIVNARYMWLLYTGKEMTEDESDHIFKMLDKAYELAGDSFYLDRVEDYDWERHRFLTLYYFAFISGNGGRFHFGAEQLKMVSLRVREFENKWKSDPEKYSSILSENEVSFFVLRSDYEAGEITGRDFRRSIISLYDKLGISADASSDTNVYFWIPTEYLLSLKGERLTESDKYLIGRFFRNSLNYTHVTSGSEALCDLLEYLSEEMRNFIEVPGGITFEEMGLGCLAALHPPTYVHSMMVAQIARCITRHLLKKDPALFESLNIKDHEQIESFAYHAALCHDFGKLMIADTIMVYGRNLLDEEYIILREHPKIGSDLLMCFPSTRAYANIALCHHISYDSQGGYPGDVKVNSLPEKIIIDIVTCADCLDAATDNVGRSYKKSKTIEEFSAELKAGSGTRYAPFLSDLFEDESFKKDLEYLLLQGRRSCYSRTYQRIQDLTEQSVLYGENI